MEILIISGLSGAGKSRAASFLEDMGFYIVDNMPAAMILKFAEFCAGGNGRYDRVALVYDVRTASSFTELFDVLDKLKDMEAQCRMLFLEAAPEVIIKRYKETRRIHPLAKNGRSLAEAVRVERTALEPVRQRAEYIVDTSALSTAKLRGEMLRLFGEGDGAPAMSVSVISFGFKYGIPIEAGPDRTGRRRAGLRIRIPADQGLHEAPGEPDGLSAPPLCGGGKDRTGHRRGLYRRAPPLGGGDPRIGRLHPAEGLQRRGEPQRHDAGLRRADL